MYTIYINSNLPLLVTQINVTNDLTHFSRNFCSFLSLYLLIIVSLHSRECTLTRYYFTCTRTKLVDKMRFFILPFYSLFYLHLYSISRNLTSSASNLCTSIDVFFSPSKWSPSTWVVFIHLQIRKHSLLLVVLQPTSIRGYSWKF